MNLFRTLTLVTFGFATVATIASSAQAQYRPERGYRYQVKYSDWDRGVHHYYNYTETHCSVNYSGRTRYSTCYEMSANTPLYIEERHISGGYQRIHVYEREHDVTPYATYYVYNDGVTRRIERRDFHRHSYYHDPYYHPYWHTHHVVWVSLDWDNGWDKIVIGSYTMLIGAQIATSSNDPVVQIIGLAIMGAGAVSASAGSNQLHEESELAKFIAQEKKNPKTATDID